MQKLVDHCNSSNPCPAIWETANEDELLIQGYVVDDATLERIAPPSGESVVRIPKSLLLEYAQQLLDDGELSQSVPA